MCVIAVNPESSSDEFVAPSAVSLIVPPFNAMFVPPTVRTSFTDKLLLVALNNNLLASDSVGSYDNV